MMLLVMPLLVAGIVATAFLSTSAATTGIANMAVRLMLFKTNELEKQMYGQWDLLVRNGFADEPEYIEASKLTVGSYAHSLAQSRTELVFAVNGSGETTLATRPLSFSPEELERVNQLRASGQEGWVEFTLDGRRMVGEALSFEPFDWYVVVADERTAVFREVRNAAVSAAIVLGVPLLIGVGVLLLFSRHLAQPLREITVHIDQVTRSGEFSRPLEVDRSDEVGLLARRFNYMASTVVSARKRLTDFATVTTVARNRAAAGELETLEVLGRAAEQRDHETAAHVLRVGRYAQFLGSLAGLDNRQTELLLYAAPLHDVGKIGIPDSILLKKGKLTDDEFAVVKTHTTIGFRILQDSRSEYLQAGATIAMYHHEWFDGSGYPNGIAGTDIPLFARIVGVVDTFDAVTTDRPYKKGWTLQQAMEVLEAESGTHLDPELARAFIENADAVREIMIWRPRQS
jgi:HD-GYP domain-containing protein (c-di-GMP phosphodiesterase class II)